MNDPNELFRLVYASRNLLPVAETDAAVAAILAASRRRNPEIGVTGALLFSEDCFAQALEGPSHAVETLFELIQIDLRHDKVVVMQAGPVAAREFGDWSMGYAGRQAEPALCFAALCGAPGEAGSRVLEVLRGTVGRTVPALA